LPVSLARVASVLSLLAFAGCGSSSHEARTPGTRTLDTPPDSRPAPRTASPNAIAIPGGAGHLAAMAPKKGLTLREKPNGGVIAHLKAETSWGSPTVVWATGRRGDWLSVVATALPNNRLGWLDVRHDRPRMWRSRLDLLADLSERTLVLRRGNRVIRRVPVEIGATATPTPVGRFAVTDKLLPTPGVAYYGCCLLALSGHQSKLRPGWAGGDRIAIHGSRAGQVGTAASAGCLRASNSDLRALMKIVPLGTPVVIRA
jgi:hypothetical protein